ncbi:hypothetical protein VVD49_21450 [Uliginosibacterium sp. H3]|uniref:Uncharacterized protein n=1 Tax=Uliginosibacterium silvisoli TaxID=3114758 RepID=A0ABU6K914_9RHOO|nr:hypothetical protein [Uliginosibacterium sp. H3]
MDITSINVMFILKKADLEELLPSLLALQEDLEKRPRSWREHLGEVVHPGMPAAPLNPLLFRSRALNILSLLRNLVESALCQNKLLVYGNGVCYRHLIGAVLPEGYEEYS